MTSDHGAGTYVDLIGGPYNGERRELPATPAGSLIPEDIRLVVAVDVMIPRGTWLHAVYRPSAVDPDNSRWRYFFHGFYPLVTS